MRDLHGGHHDQRRQRVGQQVSQHDARGRQPQPACRLDVLLVAFHQRGAARGARVVGPLHRDQRDDDLVDALAQHRQQDQRHQDRREAELDVDHPHQHLLEAAAGIGGQHAQHRAQRERDRAAHHAHVQRHTQSVQDGAEHVAALAIGTQQVGHGAAGGALARRLARVHQVEARQEIRILRRDQWRQQRHANHRQQHRQPEQRQAALGKLLPEAAQPRFGKRGGGGGAHVTSAAPAARADRAPSTAGRPPD